MKRSLRTSGMLWIAGITLLVGQVHAHGFVGPPGGSTPFVPVGGGNVGQTGPVGGVTPPAPGQGGGTLPGRQLTGGGDPRAATGGTFAGGAAARGGGGRGTGGTTGAAKPKSFDAKWKERLHGAWKAAFLPVIHRDGYASKVATIDEAMTLAPAEGGWARDRRPAVVITYDSMNPEHVRALAMLESDDRVRSATHFFDCFKVDVGGATQEKSLDVKLSTYRADGTFIETVAGQRKLSAAFDLMERAWKAESKTELTDRLPKMTSLLNDRAQVQDFIAGWDAAIVCPDCGHERADAIENVERGKVGLRECEKQVEALRAIASAK